MKKHEKNNMKITKKHNYFFSPASARFLRCSARTSATAACRALPATFAAPTRAKAASEEESQHAEPRHSALPPPVNVEIEIIENETFIST